MDIEEYFWLFFLHLVVVELYVSVPFLDSLQGYDSNASPSNLDDNIPKTLITHRKHHLLPHPKDRIKSIIPNLLSHKNFQTILRQIIRITIQPHPNLTNWDIFLPAHIVVVDFHGWNRANSEEFLFVGFWVWLGFQAVSLDFFGTFLEEAVG